jgi:hypothetical protein
MLTACPAYSGWPGANKPACPHCRLDLPQPYREPLWEAVALPLLIAGLLTAWLWWRG